MGWLRSKPIMQTERIELHLPKMGDFPNWQELRRKNEEFLRPWEPKRFDDYSSEDGFKERVRWSRNSFKNHHAVALLIKRSADKALMGVITLDNIRTGSAQTATVGYWLGQEHCHHGYMQEALSKIVTYAFTELDLSRIEAATLKDNKPSRKLLERSGFKYEGVAQSYLQIDGRWRPHVLYANLRRDRIGTTNTGVF